MRRPVGFSFPLKYKIKLSAISPRKYKGLENQGRKKHPQSADLTYSSLVKWVNISEPSCLARFFHYLIFR